MKPKTKLQVEIAYLASQLLPISRDKLNWAFKECLEHRGYVTKTRVLCLDCGETFSPLLVSRKRAVCPHCETKISVKESKCTTDKQTNYFAIAQVFGDYQVIRNFKLHVIYKKGLERDIYWSEVIQYWISDDLKMTMFGRLHNLSQGYDSWNGSMEIRVKGHSWYNQNKYEVYPDKLHPESRFKPQYEKVGINAKIQGLTSFNAIKFIPKNPKLETLIKAKQYALLSKGESHQISTYWNTLKICLRNKYIVKDVSVYFDYLELLKFFKKDVLNSKFVCPKNLMKAHDFYLQKKKAILKIEEVEREKTKIIERQMKLENAVQEYGIRNAKFFDLEFSKGNISIAILRTIDEFKQEGEELEHCVFANEYYLKQNSLIFSAKVNGKRVETVEVELKSFKISQSRGLKNKATEYNEEIVTLMKRSLSKIKSVIKNHEKSQLLQSA